MNALQQFGSVPAEPLVHPLPFAVVGHNLSIGKTRRHPERAETRNRTRVNWYMFNCLIKLVNRLCLKYCGRS